MVYATENRQAADTTVVAPADSAAAAVAAAAAIMAGDIEAHLHAIGIAMDSYCFSPIDNVLGGGLAGGGGGETHQHMAKNMAMSVQNKTKKRTNPFAHSLSMLTKRKKGTIESGGDVVVPLLDDGNGYKTTENVNDDENKQRDYKFYGSIYAGCLAFGPKEEHYQDIMVRPSSDESGEGWIANPRSMVKRRNASGDSDRRLRLVFPSDIATDDVSKILSRAINNRLFDGVDHLAFNVTETVEEYIQDPDPVEIPAGVFGEALKRASLTSTSRSGGGNGIKSLNIENVRLVGSLSELREAVAGLSRCDSLREFLCRSCSFRDVGSATTLESSTRRMLNLMFGALKGIDSLRVLSIENADQLQFTDTIDGILANRADGENGSDDNICQPKKTTLTTKKRRRRERSKISVLNLDSCTISDRSLEVMFGEESRIEKLALSDVLTTKEQRSKIADLLRTNNRTLRYLRLTWYEGEYMSVQEAIDLLRSLEVNDTLKSLTMEVDCSNNMLSDLAPAFIDSLRRIRSLQMLDLRFAGMSGQSGLDCVSSIIRGLGENKSLKKVDLMVSGYCRYDRTEAEKEDLRVSFTKDVNESLTHALSSRSCVLEEFELYVDGTFRIKPSEEAQFWLTMNKNEMKRKLSNRPDDFEFWRDMIIENRSDPKIVYHLIRQNHALLLPS